MENFLNGFAGFLWGPVTMALIFGVGIYFSVVTRFFSVRKIGYVLKSTLIDVFKKDDPKEKGAAKSEGTMTAFQALATSLAGSVGTGNIAGIATAIAIGGPGAIFWMMVTAVFGMTTKMVECALAVHYREKDENGNFYGGPMYYIQRGLGKKWKPLSVFYAIMMLLGALGTAVYVQPYTMAEAMKTTFNIPQVVTVLSGVILTGVVIIGGFKRIGQFCEKLTTFMSLIFIVIALGVIVVNIGRIPAVFALMFKYAFRPIAAAGGFAGAAVSTAIKRGVSRGTFSNEAGMGSTPIVHATAVTDHPIRQSLFGIMEVFLDTIVMCFMTGLVILAAGEEVWQSGLNGAELAISAFSSVYGGIGGYLVAICLWLFAYATMVGYAVEYETSVVYLFGQKAVKLFRWIYLIPPFLTLGQTTEMIWTVVDIATGITVIPNLIALIFLSKVFTKDFKDFETRIMPAEAKARRLGA